MNEGQGGKERPREWVGERRRESLVVGKLSLASVSLAPALCLSPFLPFPELAHRPPSNRGGTLKCPPSI